MVPHLTALTVGRHKYPAAPLCDGKCEGLRLEASKPLQDGSQRKSWIYRYRAKTDGRVRQMKLGMFPLMSLADARAAWAVQKAIRDDPARGEGKPQPSGNVTPLQSGRASAAQLRYVGQLIEQTGADREKLLAYFNVSQLEELTSQAASRAIKSLEKNRRAAA